MKSLCLVPPSGTNTKTPSPDQLHYCASINQLALRIEKKSIKSTVGYTEQNVLFFYSKRKDFRTVLKTKLSAVNPLLGLTAFYVFLLVYTTFDSNTVVNTVVIPLRIKHRGYFLTASVLNTPLRLQLCSYEEVTPDSFPKCLRFITI